MKNEKLKQAIKDAGYTQEKLGVKLGVTGQTICNAVNGRMPHENTRKAIAKALNSTVDKLFNN
jgi:DNA-binding XRE family transcriptional regulator